MDVFCLLVALQRRRSVLLAAVLLFLLLLLRQLPKGEVLRLSPGGKRRSPSARPAWVRPGPPAPQAFAAVFLKTHKTGSSTVQNILFRASERRNLTLAFPLYAFQFAYPRRFSRAFVEALPAGAARFDLLCSHMRLEAGEARALMPARSAFLTILRHPVQTFQSVFHYYRHVVPAFQPLANRSRPLRAFLEASHRFYDAAERGNGLARNPMAFDLGLEAGREEGPPGHWMGELERLNRTFQLVMIAEHFDESLLLAGELLGLGLEELVYVRLNVRRKEAEEAETLPEGLAQKIRAWNWFDVQLYQFFQAVFWRRVERYGYLRMKRELDAFRALRRETAEGCLDGGPMGPEALADDLRPWQPSSVAVLGYRLRPNLTRAQHAACFRLVLPELQYHAYLYRRQYGRDMRPLPAA